MSEITEAIEARQAQITQLQSDIETLQQAASIVDGQTKATVAASSQPKPTPKTRSTKTRPTWSAADKRAISKRMKAYWAKRRKAKQ